MKAIAANKVEGFPPPDKLRTVYVEHDIQVGCSHVLLAYRGGDDGQGQRYSRAWACSMPMYGLGG